MIVLLAWEDRIDGSLFIEQVIRCSYCSIKYTGWVKAQTTNLEEPGQGYFFHFDEVESIQHNQCIQSQGL